MKNNIKTLLAVSAVMSGTVLGGFSNGVEVAYANDAAAVSTVQSVNKTVTISGLNVRSQAQKGSAILGTLNKGDVIEVVDVINGWNKFTYKGQTGYVDRRYVTETTAAATVSTTATATTTTATVFQPVNKTVTISGLNVRSQAQKGSAILGSLSKGDVIEVVDVINGWNKFTYKGQTGYVDRRYVTETTAAVTVSTTATAPTTSASNSTATTTTATTAFQPVNKTVTITGLNVRSQAQKGSAILGSLKKGDVIEVVDVINGWNKFTYNGQTGYVDRRYVTETTASTTVSTTAPTTTTATATTAVVVPGSTPTREQVRTNVVYETPVEKAVNIGTVNVRTGAGNKYAVSTVANKGDIVTVSEVVSSGWNKVTLSNGKTGYIYGTYLNNPA